MTEHKAGKCIKTWFGNAEVKATKEFDSVQQAAETNNPSKDAKVTVLGLSWGSSNTKLIKGKDEQQLNSSSVSKTRQGT